MADPGSLGLKKSLQWCAHQSGKSKRPMGKANKGLLLHGDRGSCYENPRVEISYSCNGDRRGFNAIFQFGGPSVEKCRDEVVFHGSTV